MLRLFLPEFEATVEKGDEVEFVTIPAIELDFEYSLYTISLWESKWKKPFLSGFKEMGLKEKLSLFKEMCMTPDVPNNVWLRLTADHFQQIQDYITDPMSATTVHAPSQNPGRPEIVTTEVIYFWMISLGIPFECEHWHLNRLLKLIQVVSIKSSPGKKMSKREVAQQYRDLNEMRKAKYNTRG